MNNFEKLQKGIYRLKVPFDTVWTSVFLLKNENGSILFDTATTKEDVENYILPALGKKGIYPDYILYSHNHSDHAGGFEFLVKKFPKSDNNKTLDLKDGTVLLNRFKILELKGHTEDSIGILDLVTSTLLSADSLQQKGVDKYKTFVYNKRVYLNTISKLKQIDIKTIICSHNYEPCGDIIIGEKNVLNCYKECEKAVEYL